MTTKPELSLEMAKLLILSAQEEAAKLGYNIVVSIFDNHGNIKAFERMDNTSVGSIAVSQLKAKTSASFPIATAQLAERSSGLAGNPYANLPDFTLLGGGEPIITPEQCHIGAIGISGATPEIDAHCAHHALNTLFDRHDD